MNFTQAAEAAVMTEAQAVDKARGGDPTALYYVQSYHKIRTAVGFAGMALPFILVIGWGAYIHGWDIFRGRFGLQGSLSAYYHTGMRDFFVSILVVVGVLLVTYKLANEAPDNRLGTAAGIMALGVAFIPTAINEDKQPNAQLTAIQDWLGEEFSKWLHYGFAIGFIVLLARICLFFAELERKKQEEHLDSPQQWMTSAKWSTVHRLAAYIIFIVLVIVGASQLFKIGEGYSILVGEAVATIAFGVSWFVKGLDLKVLKADSQQVQGSPEAVAVDIPAGAGAHSGQD